MPCDGALSFHFDPHAQKTAVKTTCPLCDKTVSQLVPFTAHRQNECQEYDSCLARSAGPHRPIAKLSQPQIKRIVSLGKLKFRRRYRWCSARCCNCTVKRGIECLPGDVLTGATDREGRSEFKSFRTPCEHHCYLCSCRFLCNCDCQVRFRDIAALIQYLTSILYPTYCKIESAFDCDLLLLFSYSEYVKTLFHETGI